MSKSKLSIEDLKNQAYALQFHIKRKLQIWPSIAIFINTFAEEDEKKNWFEIWFAWQQSEENHTLI